MRPTLAAILVPCLASLAVAQTIPYGDPLTTRTQVGPISSTVPPLDTTAFMALTLGADDLRWTGTHSMIGLYMENLTGSADAYPWPLYVELRTNNARPADGVGIHSRLRNMGSGMSTAYHADVLSTTTAGGLSMGLNIEAAPMTMDGRVIGLNINAIQEYDGAPALRGMSQGINLQSRYLPMNEGIRFDGCDANTGVLFDYRSHGNRAISIEGVYAVGIYSNAPIVVTRGTPIALEESRAITVSYESGKIIFRNRSRILGYLVTDATASGGRLN